MQKTWVDQVTHLLTKCETMIKGLKTKSCDKTVHFKSNIARVF